MLVEEVVSPQARNRPLTTNDFSCYTDWKQVMFYPPEIYQDDF